MFKNLLQSLSFLYEVISDRFEVSATSDPQDIQTIFKLREEVFGDELKRTGDGEKGSPAKPDDLDANCVHFVCRDTQTGEIIGAVRSNPASQILHNPAYVKEYGTMHVRASLLNDTIVISRLILKKAYRKSTATLKIFETCYEDALSKRVALTLVSCEPNLYPVYRKLGFCPLDRIHLSSFGGYRVPVFFIIHNRDYLIKINSPLTKVYDRMAIEFCPAGLDWLNEKKRLGSFVEPGFTFFLDGAADNDVEGFALTHGMSDNGVNELLTNAIHIKCQVGDKVLAQDAGGRNMGIVKNGLIEVRRLGKLVAVMGPGDIFGEIAFIIDQPRTADVIAATPNTEVILLSASSLKRLSSANDRERFWQNVSEVLAKRIVAQNARVIKEGVT